MALHELTCVVHVHSVHSDGTGTIPEIAAAAAAVGAGAVVVTDHDHMGGRVHGGWQADGHEPVLVLVGVEVSPRHGSHLLALGVDRPPHHTGRTMAQVLDEVHDAGGVGFAAHPFSRGGWVLGRAGRAAPFGDLRLPYDGIEVWSLVTDTLEHIRTPWRLLRFGRDPDAVLADPPRGNLAAWDELGATRRVPALAGLDAHQYGLRRGGRVRVRAMTYERSFALLRTHLLLTGPPSEAAVVEALRAGRAFIARDSLADATGFRFGSVGDEVGMGDEAKWRPGLELVAHAPRRCALTVLRDGAVIAAADDAAELRHVADAPGVYRVEARVEHRGKARTWVLSNAVYLR